jgi:glycosyltransferase involved in cell wall biosynthesis
MGTLYSRNIGVISARGKFIFALDNDDLLFNRKIFWKLYKEGINNNFDIIGFKTIYGKNYNSSINYMFDEPFIKNKKSKIVFQPELKFLSIKNNDIHIWGKIIKKEIYAKAINLIGIKRYSVYLCITEDDIMVFMLYNSAKSYKYLPIYGLFHLVSNETASFTLPKNHIFFAKIFYSEIIFDFTKNDYFEKNFIIKFALNLLKHINKDKKLSNNNRLYLKRVLIKMMNYNYINNKLKLFIRKNFKEFV